MRKQTLSDLLQFIGRFGCGVVLPDGVGCRGRGSTSYGAPAAAFISLGMGRGRTAVPRQRCRLQHSVVLHEVPRRGHSACGTGGFVRHKLAGMLFDSRLDATSRSMYLRLTLAREVQIHSEGRSLT